MSGRVRRRRHACRTASPTLVPVLTRDPAQPARVGGLLAALMSIVPVALAALLGSAVPVAAAAPIGETAWGRLALGYDASGRPEVVHTPLPWLLPTIGRTVPGNPYGTAALAFGVADAPQPPGVHGQALSFLFYSDGYFAQNPAAHIAIVLKGRWAHDDPVTPVYEGDLSGRGIVIGNVSARGDGCRLAPTAQVESFWRGGNALFPETCSQPLRDRSWYRMRILASNARGIAYQITDLDGSTVYANHAMQDPGAHIDETLGGFAILQVFESVRAPTWRLWFDEVRTWWY